MKKVLLVLLLLLFCCCYNVWAYPITKTRTKEKPLVPKNVVVNEENLDEIISIPAVDARVKVYDFADLLTEEEEKRIGAKTSEFVKNTGLDAVIITVDDLKGFSLNDYTYRFYDYNDFLDSGVAFVISTANDKTSIFMGNNGPRDSKVFIAYTNANVNTILKYIYEKDIVGNDYYNACMDYLTLIDGFYIKEYGYETVIENPIRWGLITIITICVSIIVVVGSILIFGKKKRYSYIDQSLDKEQMIVKLEYNKVIE